LYCACASRRLLWARAWLLLAGLCLLLTLVSFVLFVRVFFQTQGRYFYPALLPISVFWALGWERLVPERYRPTALLGFTGVTVCVGVGVLEILRLGAPKFTKKQQLTTPP
jgi:hypothetical protein